MVAACCVLTAEGRAQDQAATKERTGSPQVVLSGQMELARLVDLAADRLKLSIEYDSSVLKGTVTLRLGNAAGIGVSDQELWELTNRVLAAPGVHHRPHDP